MYIMIATCAARIERAKVTTMYPNNPAQADLPPQFDHVSPVKSSGLDYNQFQLTRLIMII